ncbi:amidohydrolase family protein [Xanthomarina sp. F2636L]|uniref:amidohydrolase family protein n=1 Tax=Xanthomarina sp. F2636L TaxID=2996018 RepID=UPI00225DE323|nr:amidohydrolase family protein [Xanthomarina sp. F2636L]MCX7549472.1 amidohydrolase family protein [Xanthomarina sp. F2636L]
MSNTYDIVIKGGRVIDPETGLDAIRNVGINGAKIAVVTEDDIQGKETIDATDHVVAPGFIDMHHHNAGVPFGEKLALRDGVTTPMELEAGVYPVKDWYAALEGKCRSNYAASSGALPVREHLFNPNFKTKFAGDFCYDGLGAPQQSHFSMKWSTQISTDDQIKQFEILLEEGLADGAVGVGYPVGYMVDGCTQQESMIAQKLAGKYGQSTFVHARFSSQMPPTSGILGFMELMAPQEVYGGGIVIQHLHAQALKDTMASLELIDRAREKGHQILAEIYPYNYGASIVAADYLVSDNYGPNMGRDYKDIIETSTMTPLTKERYEELMKTAPSTSIMFYNATDEDMYKGLAHPNVVLGSDSFPYTIKETGKIALDWNVPFDSVNGHPRGAGTHAKLLRLVREKTIDIMLSDAVSKMTYLIARYLEDNGVPQMANKGRVQRGKDADITIFNPDTVQDNATMQAGGLPSSGIPYVLVNGTVVVNNSETVDNVFPGKPIYGSATRVT